MQPDFSRPVLAIDTSTSFLSLALCAKGAQHLFHQEAGNRQSDLILPEIGKLFALAGTSAAELGAIVYAQGPGAFTGLRIGAAVAQGLSAPFGTPLIGIPCLDAVASQLPDTACVLAATDARMNEVFYAWFDTRSNQRLSDYRVGPAAEISVPAGAANPQGTGNAFSLPEPPPFAGQARMPTAGHYLALAQSGRYPATGAGDANLLYVRDKVALTAEEQARRKAAG